jgi:serine/threonine protein kinase
MTAAAAEPPQPDDNDASAEIFGLPRAAPQAKQPVADPLDLAVTEFLDALRAGRQPSIDEFASRFPKRATEVRELLSVAAAMESWKIGKEQTRALKELPTTDASLPDIGGCRLIRELGRGGMGVVYEGVVLATGERVAVKLMSWRYSSEIIRKRFQQEARVARRLRHPNIVPVSDFGEEQGWCYYVMPLIEGMPLDRVIDLLKGPQGSVSASEIRRDFHSTWPTSRAAGQAAEAPPARVLTRHAWTAIAKMGIQAASALDYAHEQAVLHRDIKPANLLLDHQGVVYITDFGVAIDWDSLLTRQPLQLAGTLAYVAPEQLEGRADERSDVYALGVTLYELCTLTPAYRAATNEALLELVRAANPTRPRQLVPTMPAELERILLQAMARQPRQRFQSAVGLRSALLEFVKQSRG